MKKITTLAICCMILCSMIPLAFAEGPQDRRPNDVRKANSAQNIDARNMQIQRMEDAQQRYDTAKQRYEGIRANISDRREQLAECKADDSEECMELRQTHRVQTKQFLDSAADRILTMLEHLKERVENADIEEERKTEVLANIEDIISDVEEAAKVIENADDNSEEDVKEAVQTIREAWQKAHLQTKKVLGKFVDAKTEQAVHRFGNAGETLEKMIQRLEDAGADTTEMEALLETFNTQIEEAKTLHEEAKTAYRAAETDEELDAAKELLAQAHEKLREAHETMKELLEEIREARQDLNGSSGSGNEEETEDEEESSEEESEEEEEESDDEDSEEEPEDDE